MNKLFSKIAALSVGLAMAIGVGVAVGSKSAKVVKADGTAEFTLSSASSVTVDGVTAAFATGSGSTAPTWYSAGLRLYGSNTVTISSSNTITAITFNWEKQGNKAFATVTAGVGSYTHPSAAGEGTWSGSASEVVFTLGSSGQLQLNTFNVTYSGGGPAITYTISYNANGGSGTMESTTGSNPSVAACTFTAPSGKAFSKWNTAANGSGTDYAVDDKPGKDLSLYAIWVVSESVLIEASSTDQLSISPWSVDNNPTGIETTSYSRGWQWGGGTSAVITYTSSQSFKKVVVGASTNGDSTSLAVSVGGVAFGGSQSVTSGTAAAKTDYTFEGSGTGNVVITATNTASKSVYINKIELFFETVDPSKDTLVVKLNDATVSPATIPYSSTGLFYANDKDGNDINSDWTSSDESIFTVAKNGNNVAVVTPHKGGTATLTASAEGYNSGSFVLTINIGTLESIAVSGAMTKTSYYVGDSWSAAGLVATGSYSTGYSGDITSEVTWEFSPVSPAESVTSVVATAKVGTVSGNSSAQAVTVEAAPHSGTSEDDPFTVSEAINHIDNNDLVSGTTYYVEGLYVSTQTAWSDQYKNVTYNVTDPEDQTKAFQFYRMSASSDPACGSGDLILVSCTGANIKKHNSTYECYTPAFIKKSTLTIPLTGITLSASTTNVRVSDTLTVSPAFEPAGTTDAKTVNWASSDTSIATVTSAGVVTGVATGDVTITATSTVRTSVVGSINLHVVPNTIEGDYVLTYNTSKGQDYNTALTAANFIDTSYINGVTSVYFDAPSAIESVYVNNSPLTSYFSLAGHGSTTARLAFGLKDTLLDYVITKVILKDAKQIDIKDNTDIAVLSETKSGISYSMTHEEKDYAFYPFSETFDLNVNGNRIFASTIVITVERTGAGQMPSVVSHFEDAILRLTQEGCTAKSVSSDEWSRVKSAHTALVTKFSNADSFIADWTLEGNEGLRRYKTIIEKYGYEDFLNKGYVRLSSYNFNFGENNATVLIVISIATISTLAFTMLLVFKKKKQK